LHLLQLKVCVKKISMALAQRRHAENGECFQMH